MGAQQFMTEAHGPGVQEAFNDAVGSAAHQHGHGGYTGTIAEKTAFVIITEANRPGQPLNSAVDYAARLLRAEDPRVDDKYGPAGAIPFTTEDDPLPTGQQRWLFFGWAAE